MQVKLELMSHAVAAPQYQTAGSAGCDLLAAIMAPLDLAPGERALVPTGIKIELPPGYEAQVRPRSGQALKHGVTVLNAPGTIDSDYRGEIGVILINFGRERYVVRRGDRVAQLVVAQVVQAEWELGRVAASGRGDNGFGSTGT